MVWIALAVGVVVVAYVLAVVFWRPLKGVPREQLDHWIESLIRYYEDAASLSIVSPSTSTSFRFRRLRSKEDGCDLLFEIPSSPLVSEHRHALVDELRRQGYGPIALSDKDAEKDGSILAVRIEVSNIWNLGAGNQGARLVNTVLDMIGVAPAEKFNLSLDGARSRSRTLEARKRLGPDSLIG